MDRRVTSVDANTVQLHGQYENTRLWIAVGAVGGGWREVYGYSHVLHDGSETIIQWRDYRPAGWYRATANSEGRQA